MSPSRRSARTLRSAISLCLPLLGAVILGVLAAGPSHADEGFRYWNYSHLSDGEFVAAQTGPADHVPKDGDVEGWRFGTSTVAANIWPRADLSTVTFEAVCSGTEAAAGEKRVAVLLDYGTKRDADRADPPTPRAECAVVDAKADGLDVLTAVTDLRSRDGLICGVGGYPASGCGDPVPDIQVPANESPVEFALPAATDTATGDTADTGADAGESGPEGGLGWPVVAGVIALLAVLAAVVLRRRRVSPPGPRG